MSHMDTSMNGSKGKLLWGSSFDSGKWKTSLIRAMFDISRDSTAITIYTSHIHIQILPVATIQ
jgi:hypothetical protein